MGFSFEEYERLAAAFYAETGLIAPGKAVPAGWYQDRDEARAAWESFLGRTQDGYVEEEEAQLARPTGGDDAV